VASKSDSIGVWVVADFFRPLALRIILAEGDFCKFAGKDPEDEGLMKRMEETGGYFVWGKQVAREDSHGVWISRSTGHKKVEIMIPWKFIHMVLVGSDEQMKKFGFRKE
jgi:hypothetical protein